MKRWSLLGVAAAIGIGIALPATSMAIGHWLGVKHGCAKHPNASICRPPPSP